MRRQTFFVAIETVVFAVAEIANALTIAPIPLSSRLLAGALFAAFFAFGFVVPNSGRARRIVLVVDALFLAALAATTGVALVLTILLPVRCLELEPRNRRALVGSTVVALASFALAAYVGSVLEHRPFAVLAAPIVIPPYALILALVILSENLRRAYAALAATNAELGLRAERWQQIAILTERYQLGRDLQHEVGLGLKKIDGELEQTLRQIGDNTEGARASAFHAQRTAAFTLAALNRSISTLREASLAHGNLVATLRDMAGAFSTAAMPRMAAEIAEMEIDDPVVTASLERIAREALINVARHSEAADVTFSFRRDGAQLELLVADDGIGFHPHTVPAGGGLAIVRERAALIGATCSIESAPGRGTTLRVTVPLPPG